MTNTERPAGTSKVSSRTRGVPSGAFSATLQPCITLMPRLRGSSNHAISPSTCQCQQAGFFQVAEAFMATGPQADLWSLASSALQPCCEIG